MTKARNDYDFRRRGNASQPASSAVAIAAAMRAASAAPTPLVHLQPWVGSGLSPACYAGIDWFAVVPRNMVRADPRSRLTALSSLPQHFDASCRRASSST